MSARRLERGDLPHLFRALHERGHRIVGPRVRDHAIVLDELESAEDLPAGWTDSQGPGTYRIRESHVAGTFDGYVVGPDSLKQHFFPARELLYRAERRADGKLGFRAVVPADAPPTAYLGVRACDLAAVDVQDRLFARGPHPEPRYVARRERAFVVAVNCTEPGDLCFCASMGTGPRVEKGADLVLTEGEDAFFVEARSDAGREALDALPTRLAHADEERWIDDAMHAAVGKMGRAMDARELPELLFGRLEHPRWNDVADRCLACGNCTNVCPTCFCSSAVDESDLGGAEAARERLWDSCFTRDHGAIHGAVFRPAIRDRYRQWLTHKVGSWVSQLGTSGCVGCGRCIAWCPVGIDLTEEVAALREGGGRVPMPSAPPLTAGVMDDLVPRAVEVVGALRESGDVVTLSLRCDALEPSAGRFHQLSIPGIGEAPISISGQLGSVVEHTIRAVGAVTRALCALEPGAQVGVRGPYGRGWPLDAIAGRPVAVIAGGIGIAPLRACLRAMLASSARFPDVRLFYGARTPEDVLYAREMLGWLERPGFTLHVTVDHATPAWAGHVGTVTRLLDASTVAPEGAALLCGPEVMMRFTVEALARLGVGAERTWLAMERHVKCATGNCGRCQYGPWFVCKDGPVFRLDRIQDLFGRDGY